MAFPTTPLGVTVRFAFGANPADDSSAWTSLWVDVSDDVRVSDKITRTYGRSDESGTSDPGTCQFVLNDFSRAYTPYDHGGAHYPYVVRGVPVEVLVDYGSGDTTWFQGFVTSWAPSWDQSGNVPTVKVSAKGILSRLTQGARSLGTPMARAISRTTPLAWWSLDYGDGTDATSVASSLDGGADLEAEPASAGSHRASGVVSGSIAGPPGAPTATDLSKGGQLSGVLPGVSDTASWAVAFAMQIDPQDPANSSQLVQIRYGNSSAVGLFAGANPIEWTIEGFDADSLDSSNMFIAGLDEPFDDGQWRFYYILASSAGAGADTFFQITVPSADGQSVTTYSATLSGVAFGRLRGVTVSPTGDMKAVAHLVAWEGANLPDELAIRRSFYAYAGEVSHVRAIRIAEEEGVTLTTVDGAASTSMGYQPVGTLVSLLRDSEGTEHAVLYEDGFGLGYRLRYGRYNRPVDIELSASDLAEPPQPVDDDQHLATSVTCSRPGGGSYRYEDAAATARHGLYDRGNVSVNTQTDENVPLHAQWLTHMGAAEEMRVSRLSLNLAASPELIPDWMAKGFNGHVRVGALPNSRIPSGIDVIIEGASETIDEYSWDVDANCSPYWPWEVWQMETGGSYTVAAVNSSATSLKLATSDGPAWSSTVPYLIQANGEAMKVTAISSDTPTYIAAGTIASGNNASVSPALPAGITADVGQALFIWAAIRSSGTGTVNAPSGWTQLAVSGNCALFGKYYVTGDLAPTVTFTGGSSGDDTQARMWAMSGVSLELAGAAFATQDVAAYAAQLNSSAQNIAYPELVVTRVPNVVFYLGWKQDDWTSVATVGDAEIMDNPTTTGNDQGIVADYDIQTGSASSVTAGSFTVTGGASAISRAVVIALRATQTATVTRAVNGTSVSIPAGSTVKGWRLGVESL